MYPTLEMINQADQRQLCAWWRFLPGPGISAIGTPEFNSVLDTEAKLMERIGERIWKEFGGFTPEISKVIGWSN